MEERGREGEGTRGRSGEMERGGKEEWGVGRGGREKRQERKK